MPIWLVVDTRVVSPGHRAAKARFSGAPSLGTGLRLSAVVGERRRFRCRKPGACGRGTAGARESVAGWSWISMREHGAASPVSDFHHFSGANISPIPSKKAV